MEKMMGLAPNSIKRTYGTKGYEAQQEREATKVKKVESYNPEFDGLNIDNNAKINKAFDKMGTSINNGYDNVSKAFSGFGDGVKTLWNKKDKIGNDIVNGVKGGYDGLDKINHIDTNKYPETSPFNMSAGVPKNNPFRISNVAQYYNPQKAYNTTSALNNMKNNIFDEENKKSIEIENLLPWR